VVDHRVGWLDPVFVGFSAIGYSGAIWIVLAPLLALWAKKPVLRTTLLTAACVWASDLVATALKPVFDRPRPFERLTEADPLLGATVGASMPSGHAATSAAGAIALAVLVRRAVPALVALALLITFSRAYVGVHYPFDLVAGAALGAAVTLAILAAARALPRPSGARRRSGAARSPG
jgi:undecaprenyl-diphosphatase